MPILLYWCLFIKNGLYTFLQITNIYIKEQKEHAFFIYSFCDDAIWNFPIIKL